MSLSATEVWTRLLDQARSLLVTELALARKINGASEAPAAHDRIEGIEHLDKIIDIDQSPIGRTPRSNPATYTGMFTFIRELFAMMPESKARGFKPGRQGIAMAVRRCPAKRIRAGQDRVEDRIDAGSDHHRGGQRHRALHGEDAA